MGAEVKPGAPFVLETQRSRSTLDRSFTRAGLPPEAYLVAALEFTEPGDAGDPELLELLRAAATALSVAAGETKTIDLKLSR